MEEVEIYNLKEDNKGILKKIKKIYKFKGFNEIFTLLIIISLTYQVLFYNLYFMNELDLIIGFISDLTIILLTIYFIRGAKDGEKENT